MVLSVAVSCHSDNKVTAVAQSHYYSIGTQIEPQLLPCYVTFVVQLRSHRNKMRNLAADRLALQLSWYKLCRIKVHLTMFFFTVREYCLAYSAHRYIFSCENITNATLVRKN